MICGVLAMEMLHGVWEQYLRPRAVVGYGVKIFLPSPPNYVSRSPGATLIKGTRNTWHSHVALLASWFLPPTPSWTADVKYECHIFLLDAWLTELSLILTMAAHSEEFASLAKNIKHVWFYPHVLARRIPHQNSPAHMRKWLSEETASRGRLRSSFVKRAPGLSCNGNAQLWNLAMKIGEGLICEVFLNLSSSFLQKRIRTQISQDRYSDIADEILWAQPNSGVRGGHGREVECLNTATPQKNCNEYRINTRKANRTPSPQQLFLAVMILTSTLDVIYT